MISPTGELSVFPGARLRGIPEIDFRRAMEIRSAHVIAHMKDRVRVARIEDAAKVVDGFWDYVADVRAHYRESQAGPYLVVPHFGTFRYLRGKVRFRSFSTEERASETQTAPKAEGGLFRRLFGSRPDPEPDYPPSMDRAGIGTAWLGKSGELSVKRRIALHVAARSGVEPVIAARLLDAMLGTCCFVFDRAKRGLFYGWPRIVWARRGVMVRDLSGPPGRYLFASAATFSRRLRVP